MHCHAAMLDADTAALSRHTMMLSYAATPLPMLR